MNHDNYGEKLKSKCMLKVFLLKFLRNIWNSTCWRLRWKAEMEISWLACPTFTNCSVKPVLQRSDCLHRTNQVPSTTALQALVLNLQWSCQKIFEKAERNIFFSSYILDLLEFLKPSDIWNTGPLPLFMIWSL